MARIDIEGLTRLFEQSPARQIEPGERLVILSDLHMGDGGKNDDFKMNSSLLIDALEGYYLPHDYTLILNGDVEELLRTSRYAIQTAWPKVYELLREFKKRGKLIWLCGNHELIPEKKNGRAKEELPFDINYEAADGLRLNWKDRTLFVFHGHQAGTVNSGKYNRIISWCLRVFANTLRIGNYSVAHDSEKKIKVEQAVYDFSRKAGILSIIGHTHRPLFESLSKRESHGFQIERLCRQFAGASERRKDRIRTAVTEFREEYLRRPQKRERHLADSVYGQILVPCLFNSGCVIGKSGITSLEIRKDRIYLVFWADPTRPRKYREYDDFKVDSHVGDHCRRYILRKEDLDYVFSRIELLG